MEPIIDYREILKRIEGMGVKVNLDQKNGMWVCRGKSKKGPRIERIGNSPEWAVLSLYQHLLNQNIMRQYVSSVQKGAAWQTPWHNMSEQIGRAYAEAPAYDSNAVPHWQALANESDKQANAIRNQIRVERTTEPDPYLHHKDLASDVHKNQHLLVSTHNLDHPVWSKDQALNFRIAHQVMGHAASGGDHTWLGRNLAVSHHMPQITPVAREALFMDRIGKPAYHHHYDGDGPHKISLLSDFLRPVAEDNGEHLYVPHGGMDVVHMGHVDDSNLEKIFVPFDEFLTTA